MKHVLFLSTGLPPFPEAQTIRNVYFMNELIRSGYQLTTVGPPTKVTDESLSRMALPPAERLVTQETTSQRQTRALLQLQSKVGSNLRRLHAIGNHFLAFPDAWYGWDKQCIRTVEACGVRPDLIVSSASSQTAHMAAARLSRRLDVPWVADYGDPWTLNPIWPSCSLYRRVVNNVMEKATLPRASAVVFTTEETRQAYREWMGNSLPHAEYIACGYSAADFAQEPSRRAASDTLSLAYVGVAHRLTRNLEGVIGALTQSTGWTFQIIGSHSAAFEQFANESQVPVNFTGRVEYARSVDYIKQADVLVLMGNTGALQIPSKAYMYLASGKPILYLSQEACADNDPTLRLLREFPGVVSCANEPGAIASALKNMRIHFAELSSASEERPSMPRLKQFEWDTLAGRFVRLISDLV